MRVLRLNCLIDTFRFINAYRHIISWLDQRKRCPANLYSFLSCSCGYSTLVELQKDTNYSFYIVKNSHTSRNSLKKKGCC
uniref:Uncharacterized protein n=1 Tax=Chlorokybus atmophyticus TaxID=3144 RepID=A2CI54_CHLAT|nr:hypothetical protein ChatCp068 [Chlorokybus atmophyticus]ABM87980.1 hypothetical protein [Chlorokybus atmophyticus]